MTGGIQAGVGILKNHGHAPAQLLHLGPVGDGGHVDAFKLDFAGRRGMKAHHRIGHG